MQRGLFSTYVRRTESGETITIAEPHYNGPEYEASKDFVRLHAQTKRVLEATLGMWKTLAEIALETGAPEASASAQLRHLRKERFGGYRVERRRRSESQWEYRVTK
jgi:hypothetical protein